MTARRCPTTVPEASGPSAKRPASSPGRCRVASNHPFPSSVTLARLNPLNDNVLLLAQRDTTTCCTFLLTAPRNGRIFSPLVSKSQRRSASSGRELKNRRDFLEASMSTHPVESAKPEPRAPKGAASKGLSFARYFTTPGRHPYDEVSWERRSAVNNDERGQPVFEQHGIEVPSTWSQTATNIVASKYFRGQVGAPDRESSVRGLISRVVDTITAWAEKQAYFATAEDLASFSEELTHLLVRQKAAFNSPVWFNVGIEKHPQASACFINSVKDTMDSILGLAKTEGMLFKFGSGTGSNLSSIRSSKEPLAGGGTASGPVSFMRGYDAFAGVIKSGGKTRRAAKMVILNTDHPDILEFINCKVEEEKKAWALIEAGYEGAFNVKGGAYDSVFFQNANHSVRATDEFMRAVVEDREWQTRYVLTGEPCETFKARDLMKAMAEAAWQCGDPG